MSDTWSCRHGVIHHARGDCDQCLDAVVKGQDPSTMTGEEREAELREGMNDDLWGGVPIDAIHQRVEQLVGRPVWTHEMSSAGTDGPGGLYEEARTWEHPENPARHAMSLLKQIAGKRPIIEIVVPPRDGTEG